MALKRLVYAALLIRPILNMKKGILILNLFIFILMGIY